MYSFYCITTLTRFFKSLPNSTSVAIDQPNLGCYDSWGCLDLLSHSLSDRLRTYIVVAVHP